MELLLSLMSLMLLLLLLLVLVVVVVVEVLVVALVVVIVVVVVQWRRKVPKSVCVCVGGGAHRHVIYVPSVKNQYKRVVFGCMVIY